MRFENKVAFVTGASSGIGRACGIRFQKEGAKVFAVARREDRLKESFEHYALTDVTNEDQVKAAVEKCIETFGKIDVLVNAAGVIGTGGILDTSKEEWDRLFSSNVDSLYYVTRHAAPELIKTKGAIVNLSSVCIRSGQLLKQHNSG